jgi:hypothetical protein
MAPKPEAELPFQGIPVTIYMDNGPVSRSKVFQSVMGSLGVRVLTHMPPSEAERRAPARSKGKVERPFRTIKEVHETLYHFHKPKDEAEANLWMRRALVTYNNGDHRAEPHSRVEDWLKHLPPSGVRTIPELRDLMRKNKHPVVLIVDEAHELHHKTLTGFKRLMEMAAGAGMILSVLLIGHPKLRNDLRRPQMEEIGYRTTTFEFEGVSRHRREFIGWLVKTARRTASSRRTSLMRTRSSCWPSGCAPRCSSRCTSPWPSSTPSASAKSAFLSKSSSRCCRVPSTNSNRR